MPTRTPFGLDFEAQDQPATASSAEAAAPPLEPLITGDDTALWIGFGAVMAVFLIILVAVIRARVIKPAERIARSTDFFEPAGADADITFDDAAQMQVQEIKKARKKKRAEKDAVRQGLDQDEPIEVESEDAEHAAVETGADEDTSETDTANAEPNQQMAEIAAAIDDAAATDGGEKGLTGSFANLFNRDTVRPKEPVIEDDGEETLTLEEEPVDVRIDHLPEVEENYWDTDRQRQEAADAYERADAARRLALEEAARARSDADAAHRRLETEREAAARAAESERQAAEAVREERLLALSKMQGKLDAMADQMLRNADTTEARLSAAIEEKFAGLREDLQKRLDAFAAGVEKAQQLAEAPDRRDNDERGFKQIATHIDALQKTTASAMASLAGRIDELSASKPSDIGASEALQRLNAALAQRAAPAVAGALQLNDLVRSALPAGRYAFDYRLTNGANADCLVKRSGGDIAIDASFPVDAFDRYVRADDTSREHAATAYRRAVLRHMIFVAEKLIAPEETADFAILFTPSDTIFTDLHQNFADLIQDSYRARIWIASPTSLMATLHMINAAAQPEAEPQASAAAAAEKAIAALTDRIGALENKIAELNNISDAAPAKADPAHGAAPVDETPPAASRNDEATPAAAADTDEAEVEIIDAGASPMENETTQDNSAGARTRFPLR